MKTIYAVLAVACAGWLGVQSSHAVPVQLAATPINSQPANLGDGTVEDWLEDVVDAYNTVTPASLPNPGDQIFRVNQNDPAPSPFPTFGDDLLSINIPAGYYNYIVLHWGGGQTPNPVQAFYIGNDSLGTSLTFPAPGRNGLSFYAMFGPSARVPDAGATALLLGIGLALLAPFTRKQLSR